jgi:hypothetical protein
VTDERVRRQLRLEERRRPHERGVGAGIGRALRERDRLARRLASCAGDQQPAAGNRCTGRLDHANRVVVAHQRRFAVRTEDDDAANGRCQERTDVVADSVGVDRLVGGERRRKWREDTVEIEGRHGRA